MSRILVVEDDFAFAEALELLLSSEGFDVDVARDGKEGLHRMRERPPDLVISNADDVFEKPFLFRDLLTAVHRLVDH